MPFSNLLDDRLDDLLRQAAPANSVTSVWQHTLLSVGAVLATGLVVFILVSAGFPSPEALGIVFVLPVLVAAIFLDLPIALLTVALSVIAYQLALIPHDGFQLTRPHSIAKVVVLLAVTLVVSALATRLKRLGQEAQARERIMSGLYALSHQMLGLSTVKEVRAAATRKLAELTGAACHIALATDDAALDPRSRRCLADRTPVTDGRDLRLPLVTGETAIGVLTLTPLADGAFDPKRFPSRILATLSAQTAIALERAQLSESNEERSRRADRERFMSALLSSVSHDFKTPLVTIVGAFSALRSASALQASHQDLIASGLEEARRLDRFVTNLIEISRLEAGLSETRHDPILLRDSLASAIRAVRPLVGGQTFRIETDPDFPLLRLNAALLELVLVNLLENALKYGPADGRITICAYRHEDGVVIDVDDDGDGIPPDLRDSVFQKFFRVEAGDRKVAGTGLGLYICKEIVASWSGEICAVDPPDGTGACIRITLPGQATEPLILPEEV